MQVMCSVKTETEPHQENAAVGAHGDQQMHLYLTLLLLCRTCPPWVLVALSISSSQTPRNRWQRQLHGLNPQPSLPSMDSIILFVKLQPINCHQSSSVCFDILPRPVVSEMTRLFSSYPAFFRFHNKQHPRPSVSYGEVQTTPKAAFLMSMAASSAKHICSSLGNRVKYSPPYLSNQLLRGGDFASSDIF